MTTLCFIDTETTGLDPVRHEIWEVACVIRERLDSGQNADTEHVWQLPVDLARADTIALNIGHFQERRWRGGGGVGGDWQGRNPITKEAGYVVGWDAMGRWAAEFARLTWGAHLIGCVPSFDENRLERLLRKHGACPGWHYQPIDVETLAAGYVIGRARGIALAALSDPQANEVRMACGIDAPSIGRFRGALDAQKTAELPIDSEAISREVGVDPDKFDRHTALGDVLWARAIWDAVHNPSYARHGA